MCGRFTLVASASDLEAFFKGFVFPSDLLPRYNVAPTQDIAVALNDDSENVRMLRWGLVPFWAKDPKIGSRMINARAETLVDKPSFRDAFRKKRCLVFTDGFYEWKKTGEKQKRPMRIRMRSKEPFAMAGLWDTWKTPEGDHLGTCTIITTTPNTLMEPIHNRMPAVLASEAYGTWLRSDDTPDATLQATLKPYPASEMVAYPVSTTVNSVRNDTPSCIEPSPEADAPDPDSDTEQPQLF